ncbi:hypothetical protein Tco_1073821 [Tanacetum coccineum]
MANDKGGKKTKAKPSFSDISKAKASILAKAFGSSSSKAKASPKTLIVKSPIHIAMTGAEEKKEKRKMRGGS